MNKKAFWLLFMVMFWWQTTAAQVASAPVALTGVVSSDEEGHMEGVLVSAKSAGSNITVTVVSDRAGRYSFPASKLQPGKYDMTIRAAGYDLSRPTAVEVGATANTQADLKLVKAKDPASQLMSVEWLNSVPGTEKQKKTLFTCVACHQLTPVVKSTYDEAGWLVTLNRMRNVWEGPSTILEPQQNPHPHPERAVPPEPEFAKYLASINLSGRASWTYELKTLPRPKGEATKVIITEYELPRPGSLPHDAKVDKQGMVWFNDFHRPYLGVLDPRSGKVKEWEMPLLKSWPPGYLGGALSLQIDEKGNPWIPRFYQGCQAAEFDRTTEKFRTWTPPPEDLDDISRCGNIAVPTSSDSRPIWMADSEHGKMFKLDLKTGQFSQFDAFPEYVRGKVGEGFYLRAPGTGGEPHHTYGVAEDSMGNGYYCDISGGAIGVVDAKTGKVSLYRTPTPDSGPRRDFMDSKDRFWFGEYQANQLGMFDTKTKQFKEWAPPIPWNGLYPVVIDKNGDAWSGGMSTDYVFRLNPSTGQWTEYLLPTRGGEIRDIDADNSTNSVTIWVPEVHQGKIAKLEILEQ